MLKRALQVLAFMVVGSGTLIIAFGVTQFIAMIGVSALVLVVSFGIGERLARWVERGS